MAGAALAPVEKAARIESLDVLRGIAVLGILIMNIVAFGLPFQAYYNPMAAGGGTGVDLHVFEIVTVLFEGTMRGIFSMLFGVSIVLLTARMEQAGAGLMAAEIYFRRMLWMLVAGVIHWSLLLWSGEILFAYSLCGLVLFAVRKLDPRIHLAAVGFLLGIASVVKIAEYHDTVAAQAAFQSAEAARTAGASLTPEQERAIEAWDGIASHTELTPEAAQENRDIVGDSYWNAVVRQFPSTYYFQWKQAPFWLLFDMMPFMMFGMALYAWGILGGRAPVRTYLLMMVGGYAVGLPLNIHELGLVEAAGFSPVGFAAADRTYEISRLAMVIGHLGLFLLMIRLGVLAALQRRLAAVGQMALSNYLTQTLICITLFYGFGFGLYESLARHQLYYVVAAIWIAQLIWSPIWLRHFRFGPFEWVWRSLTYWERQPLRISPRTAPAAAA
jgi:uncharacterized protein